MDDNVIEGLRKRYSKLHPLIFQRSREFAKNETHLFDILESIPEKYPIIWDDVLGLWVVCKDINFQKKFLEKNK